LLANLSDGREEFSCYDALFRCCSQDIKWQIP
jgi:hypothetical protein